MEKKKIEPADRINRMMDWLILELADDLYQDGLFFNNPIHFEYEHGEWICKKGE